MRVSSVISPELSERCPVVVVVVVLSLEKARTNAAYVAYFESLRVYRVSFLP